MATLEWQDKIATFILAFACLQTGNPNKVSSTCSKVIANMGIKLKLPHDAKTPWDNRLRPPSVHCSVESHWTQLHCKTDFSVEAIVRLESHGGHTEHLGW